MANPIVGTIPARYARPMPNPFTPYWRIFEPPLDPSSFVFFVVSQINGHRRPVAVVTSEGMKHDDFTMRGTPLLAACHRIMTIFKDKSNRIAVEAELALAAGYYANAGDSGYRPGPRDLPEGEVRRLRFLEQDPPCVHPFPFITACLFQGVAFDPLENTTYPAQPEPLESVFRDSSVVWGMVVVDITDLDSPHYGIVSFASARMKFASSAAEVWRQTHTGMGFDFETGGEFRVVYEDRPRAVMSASEYMANLIEAHQDVQIVYEFPSHDIALKNLARMPMVDSKALEFIWPPASETGSMPSVTGSVESTPTTSSLPEQAIRSLINSTLNMDSFEMTIFDEVRFIPNFQEMLWRNLFQIPARLGSSRSAGQLIRLAFSDKSHVSLETLENLSVEAISAVLDTSSSDTQEFRSISLCIESLTSISIELVDILGRAESLREVCFMQRPSSTEPDGPDERSAQLFSLLASRPKLLSRVKFTFAAAFSAALHRMPWLPPFPETSTSDPTKAVQIAPLETYPVQQILVRSQVSRHPEKHSYTHYHLGDGLLKPERFASGFILFLKAIEKAQQSWGYVWAENFAFSSAPSSLADDPATVCEISHILAENLVEDKRCPPRMRDLVPGGWTAIVSLEFGKIVGEHIRYALVRTKKERISIGRPPATSHVGREDLEVMDLKQFLALTTPDVDPSLVDRRLKEVSDQVVANWHEGAALSGTEPLSTLTQPDAAEMLLEFLEDAGRQKELLRLRIKKDSEGKLTL